MSSEWYDVPAGEMTLEQARQAVTELRKMVNDLLNGVLPWIPVSDRLPKQGETEGNVTKYYLVQGEYGDMFVACYYNDKWQQIFHYDGEIEEEVVAWTELPQRFVPKEECRWVYDKRSQNWVCPKCGEPLPKTYVCDEDFMREHFRFCNHCGEQLVGEVDG